MTEYGKYHSVITQVFVKPIDETVNSERGTTIQIVDEGGGCFLEIEQFGGKIRIDPEEWPAIAAEISHAFQVCKEIDGEDK